MAEAVFAIAVGALLVLSFFAGVAFLVSASRSDSRAVSDPPVITDRDYRKDAFAYAVMNSYGDVGAAPWVAAKTGPTRTWRHPVGAEVMLTQTHDWFYRRQSSVWVAVPERVPRLSNRNPLQVMNMPDYMRFLIVTRWDLATSLALDLDPRAKEKHYSMHADEFLRLEEENEDG